MSELALTCTPGAEKLARMIYENVSTERGAEWIDSDCVRFQTGEGKGVIKQSIRGKDLYIVCDVITKYKDLSPDEHFADLKRIIHATSGKAERINVIMPFLYESRQHKRGDRESLDCAMALKELESLGVENIITLDVHHHEVVNAIPTIGFESISASYQFLKKFLCDVKPDLSKTVCVSPDEGGISRAVKLANMLHCEMAMYYKQRDCTKVIDGKNPVIAHVYLGNDVKDKICIIVDDMISSGGSVLKTAEDLKQRGADKVYIFTTFGLFTEGTFIFDIASVNHDIDGVYCTNAIDVPVQGDWFNSIDISEYLASIIQRLHDDESISDLIEPSVKVKELMVDYL